MADGKAKDYMRSVVSFTDLPSMPTGKPAQYGDVRRQYMKQRSADMVKHRARLTSDLVRASCQGLSDDFYEYCDADIRLADVTGKTAGAMRKSDDYKHILFADPAVSYFPVGAKVETMGSIWLCINPSNLSSAIPTAIIARCNASYRSYDAYGNVVTEPLVIERQYMLGNTTKTPENLVMMDGYFNVICQKNANTARLGENKRIILGERAYHITGFADFVEEFTGDRDSARLMTFTVRVEEPTEYDDLTLGIADGRSCAFSASMRGASRLAVGQSADFDASFLVNGDLARADLPHSFRWSSDDMAVATVDGSGRVTAVGIGSTVIRAVLAENTDICCSVALSVENGASEAYVAFSEVVEASVTQFSTRSVVAALYEGGEPLDVPLTWHFSGADSRCYTAKVSEDGRSCDITCLFPSDAPLVIRAGRGEVFASVSLGLEGY